MLRQDTNQQSQAKATTKIDQEGAERKSNPYVSLNQARTVVAT
jgi:IMP cyclohydrolase